METGHLVYALNGVVTTMAFDLDAREVLGGPVPLVEGVQDAFDATGAAQFSVSATGSLVYVPGSGAPGVVRSLVWVDRHGAATPLTEQRDDYWYPRISPDGQRVAVAIAGGTDADIWVLDVRRGTRSRVTFGGDNRYYLIWTPDGARLTYADNNTNRIVWTPAAGGGEVTTLLDRDEPALYSAAEYKPVAAAARHSKGPFSTPVYGGGLLYTFGATGVLSAFDAGSRLVRHTCLRVHARLQKT